MSLAILKMAYYLNKMKRTNKTAYESAIHLLNYRPQSEYELRTKLARKGYDPDEIGKVMDKLKHYGYLNDSELADDLFDSGTENVMGTPIFIRSLSPEGSIPISI